jgi:hypothetical protein
VSNRLARRRPGHANGRSTHLRDSCAVLHCQCSSLDSIPPDFVRDAATAPSNADMLITRGEPRPRHVPLAAVLAPPRPGHPEGSRSAPAKASESSSQKTEDMEGLREIRGGTDNFPFLAICGHPLPPTGASGNPIAEGLAVLSRPASAIKGVAFATNLLPQFTPKIGARQCADFHNVVCKAPSMPREESVPDRGPGAKAGPCAVLSLPHQSGAPARASQPSNRRGRDAHAEGVPGLPRTCHNIERPGST